MNFYILLFAISVYKTHSLYLTQVVTGCLIYAALWSLGFPLFTLAFLPTFQESGDAFLPQCYFGNTLLGFANGSFILFINQAAQRNQRAMTRGNKRRFLPRIIRRLYLEESKVDDETIAETHNIGGT